GRQLRASTQRLVAQLRRGSCIRTRTRPSRTWVGASGAEAWVGSLLVVPVTVVNAPVLPSYTSIDAPHWGADSAASGTLAPGPSRSYVAEKPDLPSPDVPASHLSSASRMALSTPVRATFCSRTARPAPGGACPSTVSRLGRGRVSPT